MCFNQKIQPFLLQHQMLLWLMVMTGKIPAEVVKREAIRNATSTTHASFMCVFALSSVTGMVLTSVYPETFQQQTKYSQFQNGTIFPQVAHHNLTRYHEVCKYIPIMHKFR